jgi:hypothetical protein
MSLKVAEYEQLMSHLFDRAEAALGSNQRTELREFAEEVSDLCDADSSLIFNKDGSVEVAPEDEDEGEEGDEGDDD